MVRVSTQHSSTAGCRLYTWPGVTLNWFLEEKELRVNTQNAKHRQAPQTKPTWPSLPLTFCVLETQLVLYPPQLEPCSSLLQHSASVTQHCPWAEAFHTSILLQYHWAAYTPLSSPMKYSYSSHLQCPRSHSWRTSCTLGLGDACSLAPWLWLHSGRQITPGGTQILVADSSRVLGYNLANLDSPKAVLFITLASPHLD